MKNLADLLKVCSVLPALAILPAAAADVPVPVDGIVEYAKISDVQGGVYNLKTLDADLVVSNSEFKNNDNAAGNGGTIWATAKHDLAVIASGFENNVASSGGALGGGTTAGMLRINGSTFTGNHAIYDGGAISSFAGLSIVGATFDGNTAQYSADKNGDYNVVSKDSMPIGGGALALGAVSNTTIASIESTTFKNNKSGMNGGAIGTRLAANAYNGDAKLDIDATFENNSAAQHGGAIYNTFYANNGLKKGDGVTVTGNFTSNSAGKNGGAIYNDGTMDSDDKIAATMTLTDAKFTKNDAAGSGGAIYNSGVLSVSGTEFTENNAGSWSGAIYNGNGGSLVIKGSKFTGNTAASAGAVVSGTAAIKTEISNTVFADNSAGSMGAVGLFSGGTLTDVTFKNNKSTDAEDSGAGALFLGAVSKTFVTRATFMGNESAADGGAIATREKDLGNNSAAKLDIVNSSFNSNVAARNGGAIYSTFYNSVSDVDNVYITNTRFVSNEAINGGAIYNEGEADLGKNFASMKLDNVLFSGNSAAMLGGAIYNGAGGAITLTGDNTFVGNTAGKKNGRNDIYNLGALNIESGTTTINGGITGTGTLTLAQGATLDIGTTTVSQDVLNIDGTVNASVLSERTYGRLLGTVNAGENATLKLNVGSVGTYKIFDGDGATSISIDAGKAYVVENNGKDGITVAVKAADALVAETGISKNTAGVLTGLVQSDTDRAFHKLSLMAQESLNSGDTDAMEKELAKMNPDSGAVAQSVSASVQNQVASVVSGRVANVVGRAGGDTPKNTGFWMQGLFNKSEMDNQFHAYTRGLALGSDIMLGKSLVLGAGYMYNNTDVHMDNDNDSEIDSNTLLLYAHYKPSQWYVGAMLNYTMSDYTDSKTPYGMTFATNYDSDAISGQVVTGYDFASGVSPMLGLRYTHMTQDAYYNGPLYVKEMNTDYLTGLAGIKYARAFSVKENLKVRPEVQIAAKYDMLTDDAVATVVIPGVSAYQVAGEQMARFGGEFGLGASLLYNGIDLSVMYNLELRQDYTSHTGLIKFRGRF